MAQEKHFNTGAVGQNPVGLGLRRRCFMLGKWLRALGFYKKRKFSEWTKEDLQKVTKVLIIDDVKSEIDSLLIREGWSTKYISDLEHLAQKELVESHIICVDIRGVGAKLKFKDEGMGLARAIKLEYPVKKVILYSTQAKNNIFNDALDFVDKRVYKSGELYPFSAAVLEMAKIVFDWNSMIDELWIRNRKEFTNDVSLEVFRSEMASAITKEKLSENQVIKITGLTFQGASLIVNTIRLYLDHVRS
jgi:hypothetical protein